MNPPYCDHAWPIPDDLQKVIESAPPLPDLEYFRKTVCPSSALGVSGQAIKEIHTTFEIPSSLEACWSAIDIGRIDPECMKGLNDHERLRELKDWTLACMVFVSKQQEESKKTKPFRGLPTLGHVRRLFESLKAEVMPLLRDLAIMYHLRAAELHEEKWPEHFAWFLFLLRFCDDKSLISTTVEPNLLGELLELHQIDSDKCYYDCAPNCLKSFFSFLYRVSPGAFLQSAAWLGDVARHCDEGDEHENLEVFYSNLDWFFEDRNLPIGDPPPVVERPLTHVQKCVESISERLGDLDLDGASLLLNAFARLGAMERKLLLDLFRVDGRGVKMQDIASGLANIAYNTSRGRTSAVPADKLAYFQRAIEYIGDFRREWSDERWFEGLPKSPHETHPVRKLSLKVTLADAEERLKSARTEIPISPHLVDRRWLTETFYFALLIDHENFWGAVVKWIRKHRPQIANYQRAEDNPWRHRFFEPYNEYVPTSGAAPNESVDHKQAEHKIDFRSFKTYEGEHEHFIRHIISRLIDAFRSKCGVSLFDYAEAVAPWRYFPVQHVEVFDDFKIHTERPRVPAGKKSEAADRQITIDMMNKVLPFAREQKKKPFFILVAGDTDYLETFYPLRREGAECQYWVLESQFPGFKDGMHGHANARLRTLGDERVLWLDDILQFDTISPEDLHNWYKPKKAPPSRKK